MTKDKKFITGSYDLESLPGYAVNTKSGEKIKLPKFDEEFLKNNTPKNKKERLNHFSFTPNFLTKDTTLRSIDITTEINELKRKKYLHKTTSTATATDETQPGNTLTKEVLEKSLELLKEVPAPKKTPNNYLGMPIFISPYLCKPVYKHWFWRTKFWQMILKLLGREYDPVKEYLPDEPMMYMYNNQMVVNNEGMKLLRKEYEENRAALAKIPES